MSGNDGFVHLHVHSEYSMLDGAARVNQLMDAVRAQRMPAIAITDHGNTFGVFDFWRQARDRGINPIIGMEAYLTPGTFRGDRSRVRWGGGGGDDVSGGGAYTHMTLLAETTEGMHNLFRLSSLASIEGYYFKPRADRELLHRYAKGMIATTGCPSGEIQTRLRLGQFSEAREAAAEFQSIFGKENFYCELMDHGLEIERRVHQDLLRIAQDLGLPLLATNDLHYTHQHDASAHDALLCVQSGSHIDDPNRFKFDGDGYYLKSAAEMRQLFRELPEACDNTLRIAERCSSEFNTAASYMPRYPVPEGETEESWFVKEVERGLQYRYPQGVPDAAYKQAVYETDVIVQMGFPGYFLVVADFITWAKDHGIRVGPGRGSGPGSMAAYAMRITDLDPLQHGLIFERFLNPDRVSMPDFDVDFDDRRRGEVIAYVTEKYGDDRVAQIVTYGTIKSKQALKDASRVLGFPFGMGEKLTKAMPPAVMAKDIPLAGITDQKHQRYKEAAEFRALLQADPDAKTVYETALGLEGLKRQWGVHAAGVIMSSDPLIDIIPIMKREQDGQIVTQFDYPTCEALGLIKMDFLGLRNLTIISDALENIQQNRGETIDLERLSLDDSAAYELLSRGDSLGVFQLDSGPLRSLMRMMKPDNFEDISALIALYRPGPMGANSHINYALRKNGEQAITPIHPELEEALREILDTTYGLIIYQEQVMAVAQKVAGFSLGQADILRRAMGKKKKEELDKQYESFSQGMRDRGYTEQAITALWDVLLPFSDYAFNKAHSAAYGLISYWTAYLKAHYPAEYMAALLTSVGDSKDKLAVYLNECRRMGIQVLPPSIGESYANFAAVGADIRFGLGAVRNVGSTVVEGICAVRQTDGPFQTFHDFLKRVPITVLNKRTIESLIKSGAFDGLGATRRALMEVHESAVEAAVKEKRDAEHGNVGFDFDGLFVSAGATQRPDLAQIADRPEWSKKDLLAFEREMLGMYVSDHPLRGMERALDREADMTIEQLTGVDTSGEAAVTVIAGLLTNVQHRTAKSGNLYGVATIEDFTGEIEALFLGKSYQEFGARLQADSIVAVRGKINVRDNGVTMHAYGVKAIEQGSNDAPDCLPVVISERRTTPELMTGLREVFDRHSGSSEVRLYMVKTERVRVFELASRVRATADLYGELKGLLGSRCLDWE